MKKKWIMLAVSTLIIILTACGKGTAATKNTTKENPSVATTYQLDAKILEIQKEYLMVEAVEGQTIAGEVQVWIGLLKEDEIPELEVGDVVRIPHDGKMTMSIPPQMSAVGKIEIIE